MYIPIPPQMPPSREAVELGERLTDLIESYQLDHPDMSALEVHQAVKMAQSQTTSGATTPAVKRGLIGFLAVMGLAVFLYRSSQGGGGDSIPFVLIAVVVGIIVVGFAAAKSR